MSALTSLTKKSVTTSVPGKLILSGEHAVLYGKPALVSTINHHLAVTLEHHDQNTININWQALDIHQSLSISQAKSIKEQIDKNYVEYLNKTITVTEILKNPIYLIPYTLITITEFLRHRIEQGLNITIESSIPIGCGMGASAALIIAIIKAVCAFYEKKLSIEQILSVARYCENMQHGQSSGLDLAACLHGGLIYWRQGDITNRRPLPLPIYLTNTGTPDSSTGECIEHAAHFFSNTNIANEFEQVTQLIDQAISQNNLSELILAIRRNHQLLVTIGVVPKHVQAFINDIEKDDGAAKICGAGAVTGDQAGMVLIIKQPWSDKICQRYGYNVTELTVSTL